MQIWGLKTNALLDVWSIEHFLGGIMIGGIINHFFGKKPGKTIYFLTILILAYAWELVEYYLEIGVIQNDLITYWFQGLEHWANRLITDPILLMLGAFVAMKYKKLIKPAAIIYITWYIVNIFIFPNCMYLQRLFE